jgi:hypothetical protein
MRPRLAPLLLLPALLLAGCDLLGIESATATSERRSAEGKAVGAACRHAGRAIEDCYTLNKKAEKAAIYAGWREMDDYMRENKLEPVAPVIPVESAKPKAAADDATDGGEHADLAEGHGADKPAAAAGHDKAEAAPAKATAKPAARPAAKPAAH